MSQRNSPLAHFVSLESISLVRIKSYPLGIERHEQGLLPWYEYHAGIYGVGQHAGIMDGATVHYFLYVYYTIF